MFQKMTFSPKNKVVQFVTRNESKQSRRSSTSTTGTESTSASSSLRSSSFSIMSPTKPSLLDKPPYYTELNALNAVPVADITFDMVTRVSQTWQDGLKRSPNWERVAGEKFIRKVFESAPETITMFGFSENTRYDDPSLTKDPAFLAKGVALIKAIDTAVQSLGPDLCPLESQLKSLGARHAAMNCRPHHWPIIGEALLDVLQSSLGDRLSEEDIESWTVIYNFMSYHMVQGLLKKKPYLAGAKQLSKQQSSRVLTSPAARRGSNSSHSTATSASTATSVSGSNSSSRHSRRSVSRTIDVATIDCIAPRPVESIDFETINHVITSWEQGIKQTPDWNSSTGIRFLQYILKHCGEEGKKLMDYPVDKEWDDPQLSQDPKFVAKGTRLIEGIDMAVSFLEFDLSPLEDVMLDLGRRHYHMGCKPAHWPLVGEALLDVFRERMGPDGILFTGDVEHSWAILYSVMGHFMIKGLLAEENGE